MTRTIPVILLLILCGSVFSQDTFVAKEKRITLSLMAGASYKGFLGTRYIRPTPVTMEDAFQSHQFDRFTKKPAFEIGGGILVSCRISGHWGIAVGLSFAFRKTIYEANQDTVISYASQTSIPNIQNIVQYDYGYSNLELPVFAQFRTGKINLYAGFQLSLLTCRKATYTYILDRYPEDTRYTTLKIMTGFAPAFRIYPTLRASYDLNIKKFHIMPFLGFEITEINLQEFYLHIQTSPWLVTIRGPGVENCFYVQGGVMIPLSFTR